ncbi:uncharacterized protein N7459_002435 [Penicillium hispanicum]|uniref:uncharacterized protein n=1 Tax=Penicillium hispanicum TaxID=1080232 RepID=UPI0025415FB0|nr:uncharacterized protein N7459_002435 [Penicillium hispanicum]KAJ5586670.1 hypothetical protein N7459_002435 [Penicillium hispanicum]
MNWLWCFSRQPRDVGSSGRARVFVYLALTVVFLLFSYQLVLNHDSLGSISRWTGGQRIVIGDSSNDQSADPSSQQPPPPNHSQSPSRELVIAAMRSSDLSWLEETLPDWHANIYRADVPPGEANLTVPVNRGNEAMVYLTYLIDRYSTLPDVSVFMHHGRYQWHNDNPLYDSVISIKDLQLPYVQKNGYVNLRCAWAIGCPSELEPARYLRERPDDHDHPTAMLYPDSFKELFPGMKVPEVVGTPCCSQFAVSRKQAQKHKREEYIRLRQWLIDSKLDAGISGRIFEYSWHILFGQESQFCPEITECYCNTYGYCNMSDEDLMNQWVWRGLILPPGWPESKGN